MITQSSQAKLTEGSAVAAVRDFRLRLIENGYKPVRVRTCSKQPLGKQWQHGESDDQLLAIREDELNTGILAAGLRCIDIDVDNPPIALKIAELACQRLGSSAPIRRRPNSSRYAMVFRASDGQPGKVSISGSEGKVEVLGAGQQFVADGQHPSGARIFWSNGRGPDTVPRDQLPEVTEEQIRAFLNECEPLLGAKASTTTTTPVNQSIFEETFAPVSTAVRALPIGDDLSAGIESPKWFEPLRPEEKFAAVQACLNAINNRTNDPRDQWLKVLFAAADAERLGCPDAHRLALEWSRLGASWTSEADFEAAWRSSKPGRVGVGSLLQLSRDAGLDLSPWRDLALARLQSAAGVLALGPATVAGSVLARQRRAVHVSALPAVPEKRQWLHGTDAMRGAVTLFVAPGGRGKSTWLIALALACTSGRPLLGANIFGGPLRVLVLSAEDPTPEVARRVRAAMQHHGLTDQDVSGLHVIGANDWGLPLLRMVGNVPALDQHGWDGLNAELDDIRPDIIILDPLMSLMGGVDGNNNSAAAVLMGGFVKLAADRRMSVIVAHHAAKGRDPTSADSAMGAASFVNFSRIGLSIEQLSEKDAGRIGVLPWEAKSAFRVVGIKQNFSAPDVGDRWFRYVSVELPNQQPPIYPSGDKIAVVEVFQPGVAVAYPHAVIRDALRVIDSANPPLSPSKRATGRYAVDAIATAIAVHRGGKASDIEAAAVLEHIRRSGLVVVQRVKIARPGSRADERDGLVVTAQGKAVMQQPDPAGTPSSTFPQYPQSSRGSNAGLQDSGSPKGPRNVPRGCGGNAGTEITGKSTDTQPSKTAPQAQEEVLRDEVGKSPAETSDAPENAVAARAPDLETSAAVPIPEALDVSPELDVEASAAVPLVPEPGPTAAPANSPALPSEPVDDLDIPSFLDRRPRK